MKKLIKLIDDGLIVKPGTDSGSDDFKPLKAVILAKSREISLKEKLEIELNAKTKALFNK